MSELIIYQKNQKVFRVPLDAMRLSIGRSSQNDLILTGAAVSRQHALLVKKEDGYWLSDQSSSGTLVDGQKVIESLELQDNQKISISDWNLVFHDASKASDIQNNDRKTQITNLKKELQSDATKVIEVQDHQSYKVLKPVLFVSDAMAGQRKVDLKKRSIVIGGSSSCDIALTDDFVSKFHVELRQSDKGFHVTDLSSTNGTFVNGIKIQETFITSTQEIRIGHSKILVDFEQQAKQKLEPFGEQSFCGIYGSSHEMRLLFSKIKMVAETDMTTLIHGESGTGKEMVARAIHDLSSRSAEPYVILNCGAISKNLIESELFGHEKGAFTGADKKYEGVFEQVNGGTLFLDEVGELPLEMQTKLLRVLEYQTLRRVGGNQEIKVDFRLVVATHRDLSQMVHTKEFREDLFYRLYVLPLKVPALRERKEDIEMLSNHFLSQYSQREGVSLSVLAVDKLMAHTWPGNVRELRNTILRSVAFSKTDIIDGSHIDIIPMLLTNRSSADHDEVQEVDIHEQARVDLEKERLFEALKSVSGDKNKAAQLLKMGRSTLFRKIKEFGINTDRLDS